MKGITSVSARLLKGAMGEGLKLMTSMLGEPRVPSDMRVRVLWDKLTYKANELWKHDNTLAKNIFAFRNIICWLLDSDPMYLKPALEILRDVMAEKDIITSSTGDEATVKHLVARKAQLKASGALKKEAKSYKSDPTTLL